MRTIIERIEAGEISKELERLGVEPGRVVRVTVEAVDEAMIDVGDLLHRVRRLSGESDSLTDDTLDEIRRDVESGGR